MTDCNECGDPLPEHRDDVCAGCFELDIRRNCTEGEDAPPRRRPTSPLGKALYEFSYEVDRVERQAAGEARVWITGTADDLEERVSIEYGDDGPSRRPVGGYEVTSTPNNPDAGDGDE